MSALTGERNVMTMTRPKLLAFVMLASCSTSTPTEWVSGSAPGGKADIWGEDDRHELYHYDASGTVRRWARSVAMLIDETRLALALDGSAQLSTDVPTFGEGLGLCPNQPFEGQPVAGGCTAFLVGDDILVTAGHCMAPGPDCGSVYVVFDFGYATRPRDLFGDVRAIPADNLYRCEAVLFRVHRGCAADVAVLRVDRPVAGRDPLQFRREGTAQPGRAVVLIGHPSGLPTKISDTATVQAAAGPADSHYATEPGVEGATFHADLDVFPGNSGGPVIDAENGVVEGVAVCNDAYNFVETEEGCYEVGRCGDNVQCSRYARGYALTAHRELIDDLVSGSNVP